MIKRIKKVLSGWRYFTRYALKLDSLLTTLPKESASLVAQKNWLLDLMSWIRGRTFMVDPSGNELGAVRVRPETRLRFLLQVLRRNPVQGTRVLALIRAVLLQSDPLILFCYTGLSRHSGIINEVTERVSMRCIPETLSSNQLSVLFWMLFPDTQDAEWVEALDPQLVADLIQMIYQGLEAEPSTSDVEIEANHPGYPLVEHLKNAIVDALHYHVMQVRAMALQPVIRRFMGHRKMLDSPFYHLQKAANALFAQESTVELLVPESLVPALNYLRGLLDASSQAVESAYENMYRMGVSTDTVFQLQSIASRLGHIRSLLALIVGDADSGMVFAPTKYLAPFVAQLIRDQHSSRSLGGLLQQSYALLSRKMVESSAKAGEGYIARTWSSYWHMLRTAWGGGAVTVLTMYIKLVVFSLALPKFFEGLVASINYAGCFLLIQSFGWTLATKQPAVTAPALACKLKGDAQDKVAQAFSMEVVVLIRSQLVAVMGNVFAALPIGVLIAMGWSWLFGHSVISKEAADLLLQKHSPLGVFPWFGALTGLFLFLSSLFEAWMVNWFAFHQVHDVIEFNRRLQFVFGEKGSRKLADFWQRHIGGISANVSLGFFLGMVPAVGSFFGMLLAVPHVTLSSAAVGAALGVIGWEAVNIGGLWWAILGLMVIGALNLLISFSLAFSMAIRSRNLSVAQRRQLYRDLVRYLRQNPWRLLRPSNRKIENE